MHSFAADCTLTPVLKMINAVICFVLSIFVFVCAVVSTHKSRHRSELVIGDDNLIMLTITAMNRGEGAYESELHTLIPPEADYIGVERRVEVGTQDQKLTYTHRRHDVLILNWVHK